MSKSPLTNKAQNNQNNKETDDKAVEEEQQQQTQTTPVATEIPDSDLAPEDPTKCLRSNRTIARNPRGDSLGFFNGLQGRPLSALSAQELNRKPEDIEQSPEGVGLLQLIRYLLGMIASLRTHTPYTEDGMTLSERFRPRMVEQPAGFPVRLTDEQWADLQDKKCLEYQSGDGKIRLFANDLVAEKRLGSTAYFSHIDVNSVNYDFNVLRGELEQMGIVNARGVLQTQAEGMFAAGRFAIPDTQETERRVLEAKIGRLVKECGDEFKKYLADFSEMYKKNPEEAKKAAEEMMSKMKAFIEEQKALQAAQAQSQNPPSTAGTGNSRKLTAKVAHEEPKNVKKELTTEKTETLEM